MPLRLAQQNPPKRLLQDDVDRCRCRHRPLILDFQIHHGGSSSITTNSTSSSRLPSLRQQRRRPLASTTQNPYHRGRLKGPNSQHSPPILNSAWDLKPHIITINSKPHSPPEFDPQSHRMQVHPPEQQHYLSTVNNAVRPTVAPSSTPSFRSRNHRNDSEINLPPASGIP